MHCKRQYQRNLTLINGLAFFHMFLIIIPVFVPLMTQYGLSMQEIMITQSVFAACSISLEIPSGILADWLGRKTTLVLGSLLSGSAFSYLLWADTFIEICVFEGLVGIAFSLLSGSDTSLAFESENQLGRVSNHSAIARLISWSNFGEGIAALCAFLLVKIGMNWVIFAQVIVAWFPFILALGLTEPPRNANEKMTTFQIHQTVNALKKYRFITSLAFVFLVTSASTYLVVWLNPALWLQMELPVDYFGLLWALISLTIAFTSRLSNRVGPLALWWLPALLLLGYFTITSTSLVWVIVGAFTISVFRGFAIPILKLHINQRITNDYRATINSIIIGSFRVGTLFLGPMWGLAIDQHGAHQVSYGLLLIFIPASLGLWYLAKQQSTKPDLVEDTAL